MRATLRVFTILFAFFMSLADAWAGPEIADLPPPIRAYAEALKPYCEVIGKSAVRVNRIYSDRFFGRLDVNTDGHRDYIVYKCMFGCDGEPYAFQGLGPSCMFGSLLLSSEGGYKAIPVPGQLSHFEMAPHPRVVVYRAHIQRDDCGGAWYCTYVFELRDEWFRLVDVCPPAGCGSILAVARLKDQQRAAKTD
jgi:hypothetical protein